jgi:hypothetical protein
VLHGIFGLGFFLGLVLCWLCVHSLCVVLWVLRFIR